MRGLFRGLTPEILLSGSFFDGLFIRLLFVYVLDFFGVLVDRFYWFFGISILYLGEHLGCPQFVEAFEVVLMEDVPCGMDDSLSEIEVAFVRCKQIVATLG